MFAYGPVMVHEALTAAELLEQQGLGLAVVALPWLNRFDRQWLANVLDRYERVFVLEDHALVGGLGDALRRELDGLPLAVFGVEGWPACGTPAEALRAHGLDGASLAERIPAALGSAVA
jgi:transketolase